MEWMDTLSMACSLLLGDVQIGMTWIYGTKEAGPRSISVLRLWRGSVGYVMSVTICVDNCMA
jgi:hypothetical protein